MTLCRGFLCLLQDPDCVLYFADALDASLLSGMGQTLGR